ncbi:hypothetical protein D9M72_593140 [compost metagenome]
MDLPPLPVDLAGRQVLAAIEAEREFAASGTDQAVEADDLAGVNGERHVLEAGAAQAAGFDDHVARRKMLLVIDLLDRAVDHQGDQFGVVGLADLSRADMGAVTQHRDTIGQLEDFLHAVADVDDRHPLAL